MWNLYILRCIDSSYYTGIAIDTSRRLKNHQRGKVKYTKSRLPVILVYSEQFNNKAEASQREYQIKSWKSKIQIEKLIRGEFV